MKKTPEIEKLERDIVKFALQRLKSWKKQNPEGLRPEGHPQAITSKPGRKMIEACLALEKAKAAQ